MRNAAVENTSASGAIVETLLKTVSKEQLTKLIDVARANSGEIIGTSSFESGMISVLISISSSRSRPGSMNS